MPSKDNKAPRGSPKEKARKAAPVAESADKAAPGAGLGPAPTHEVTEIPTFTPKGLTPLQHRFCQEYLCDKEMNATQAYLRASPEVTYETARVAGSQLLANHRIAEEIQRLMDERAAITGITADRVLFRLWAMATADPREISGHRIGACRHCYGKDHGYQRTAQEMRKDTEKHIVQELKREKAEKGDFVPRQFDEMGGIGFTPKRPPNPDCPECFGDGEGLPYLADTARLSEAGAMLFKGIKNTPHGVSLEVQNPVESLQLVGRHLGMWNDKIKVTDETNPLQALIQQIQASHSTLPIVHDDPELKKPSQAQDVESRPVLKKEAAPGAGLPMKTAQKWRKV
jgi:phage terminase small subunit